VRIRRIVFWVVLALAGGALVVWAFVLARENKDADALDALLAEQAAAGHGTTVADFLAQHAAGDPTQLAAFRAWGQREEPAGIEARDSREQERAYLEHGGAMPENVAAYHRGWAPHARALEALLDDGLASVSSPVWWHRHVDEHGMPTLAQSLGHIETAPVWRLLDVVHWYVLHALYLDAAVGLRGLDRMPSLLRPFGSTLDHALSTAMAAIRDRCYLLLAWRGRLPADARARWVAEPPPRPEDLASAIDGTRLTLGIPLARALAEGSTAAADTIFLGGPSGFLERLDWQAYLFFDAAAEAREVVARQATIADVLRGRRTPEALRTALPVEPEGGQIIRAEVASMRFMLHRQLMQRATHRLVRLAVTLMAGGGAPSAEALAGGPGDHALVYEDLGAGGHRLGVRAVAAPPALFPPWNPPLPVNGGRRGKPLLPGAFATHEGSVEWGPPPVR